MGLGWKGCWGVWVLAGVVGFDLGGVRVGLFREMLGWGRVRTVGRRGGVVWQRER